MPACAAYGCYNRTDKTLLGTTFHKFPVNAHLKRVWIEAINRKKWRPTSKSLLCSLHFTDDCFDRRMTTPTLKERAIPSIFPEIPTHLQQNVTKTREKMPISDQGIKESSSKKLNTYDDDSEPQAVIAVKNFPSALCQKLDLFRKQSLFCDVLLKLNPSNKLYQVHSSVLAASSPFFEEILQFQSFEDCKKLVLTLPHYVTCVGLEIILTFMYTGCLCIKLSTYKDVFQTAWLFKMEDIIGVCQKFSLAYKLPYSYIEVAGDEVTLQNSELTKESYQQICKEIDEAKTERFDEQYIDASTEENFSEEQNLSSQDFPCNKKIMHDNSLTAAHIIKKTSDSVNSVGCKKDSTLNQEKNLASNLQSYHKNLSTDNEINPPKKRKIYVRKNSAEKLSENITNIEDNCMLNTDSAVKSNLRIFDSASLYNNNEENEQLFSLPEKKNNTLSNHLGINPCDASQISQTITSQHSNIKNLDNT